MYNEVSTYNRKEVNDIMKKKILLFALTPSMMFAMVGCGKDNDSNSTPTTTEATVVETTTEDVTTTEEVNTETTTETEVEKKNRRAGVYENSDGSIKTYAYESLDGTYSDNIVVFDDGTHKVNFTIASSSDIGAIAGVEENFMGITNSENTFAIEYFWDE